MFRLALSRQLTHSFLRNTTLASRFTMMKTAPLLMKSPVIFNKPRFNFTKRFCLTCDLKDNPKLIAEYK